MKKEEKKEKRKWSWFRLLKWLIILTIIIICFFLYMNKVATHGLITNEIKITDPSINTFHSLKIVQFSDLHYGKTTYEKDLIKLVNEINKNKPDIVVFTGDLIDKSIKAEDEVVKIVTRELKRIDANIGKYMITGEQDTNNSQYLMMMENSNFIDLNNKYDLIYNKDYEHIMIAGLSNSTNDPKATVDRFKETSDYLKGLKETDAKPIYKILIMHEPDEINTIEYGLFNLVLAGHSHGGQIRLPFIGAINKFNNAKEYSDSYYELNETKLYVSSGIGTTNYSLRLFNKPSINFFRITKR